MSFIPTGKATDDVVPKDKKTERALAKAKEEKSQFGSGLEKRTNAKDDAVIEGEDGEGRKKMRKVARSASRTVTRQL